MAPVVEPGMTNLNIEFPSGNNWIDWWNTTKVYQGGTTTNYDVSSLEILPAFHRQGSILPLEVSTNSTGHGSKLSEGSLTLLISQMGTKEETVVREFSGEPAGKVLAQEISYIYEADNSTFILKATGRNFCLQSVTKFLKLIQKIL